MIGFIGQKCQYFDPFFDQNISEGIELFQLKTLA